MAKAFHQQIDEGVKELEQLPEWAELTETERNNARQQLDRLTIQPSQDLGGLK